MSKFIVTFVGLVDLFFPILLRRLLSVEGHVFPHIEVLFALIEGEQHESLLKLLADTDITNAAWGLPFAWYSKHGVYTESTPYITVTPYVMDGLLYLSKKKELHDDALALFRQTWNFLDSLRIMHRGIDTLALSYSPIKEDRIVINANSYAAYAYALHVVYGYSERRDEALSKVLSLVRWIVNQQNDDGSWFYYCDNDSGNFIDCFHSCFMIKNLFKIRRLLSDAVSRIDEPIEKGRTFIRKAFYDHKVGLCRRFTVRSHLDPYLWDLYDQAEYLGLLVDIGALDEATRFAEYVATRFSKGNDWYCRIDVFGRLWGKNFLRWGIVPFWYHRTRLNKALSGAT